jgi:hypothetical protein
VSSLRAAATTPMLRPRLAMIRRYSATIVLAAGEPLERWSRPVQVVDLATDGPWRIYAATTLGIWPEDPNPRLSKSASLREGTVACIKRSAHPSWSRSHSAGRYSRCDIAPDHESSSCPASAPARYLYPEEALRFMR